MRKFTRIPFLLLLLALPLSACQSPGIGASSSLISWIDAPLNDSTLALAPYDIIAHGSAPDGVTMLEISVNGEVLASSENPELDNLLFSIQYSWTPPSAGEYMIRARSQNPAGDWSEPALARVTVAENYQPPNSLDLLPTETPPLALTSCEPEVTAAMNTTCRTGASAYNDAAVYLLEGETAQLQGRNQDSSWWAIQTADADEVCWVAESTVSAACIPEDLALLDSAPYITRVFPSTAEFYWGDNPLQSATIQAQCGGDSPLAAVRLVYHLAGKTQWYNTAMVEHSPGIWQATLQARNIDGYKNIESSIIEYYIEAANQAGLATKSAIFSDLKLKKVP